MNIKVSALLATAATSGLLVGATAGHTLTGRQPGSSASRTAFSFMYALKHGNFGRACSYVADAVKDNPVDCAMNLFGNTAFATMFGGGYPWAGANIVPGSREDVSDTEATFLVRGPGVGDFRLRVVKQPNGRWRVTAIESV